jgi:hypothetical protein
LAPVAVIADGQFQEVPVNHTLTRPAAYAAVLALLMAGLLALTFYPVQAVFKAKGARRSGLVRLSVVQSVPDQGARAPAVPPAGFSPQMRLGFTTGDQWEPAIAADRFGHVYVLYPQYLGVPGCADCPSPTMILQISADRGSTWGAPHPISAPGTGQWDAQIVVDPVNGRTVYAAWLQDRKSDIAVAKSTDFGQTWAVVVANSTNASTDKPILVVRGPDVYVAYNHAQKIWISSSHNGGATFSSVNVNKTGKLGWALAGGGALDPAGNVFFGWAGYTQNGGAKGPVNLFVSRSDDGGQTWTTATPAISGAPPDCSDMACGWAYLGAQLTLAVDAQGTLYGLYNAGEIDKAPERIFFIRSDDAGQTWTTPADVSSAPVGTHHAFPALAAGAAGDVRIAWMDARAPGGLWNTYYRNSTDGGRNWSNEVDLSTPVNGYSYIHPAGYNFPFGDYFELDIDHLGVTHAVWGEGFNYDTPGSIWYTRGE